MNIITESKIHIYIMESRYEELSDLLMVSDEANEYVYNYVVKKFAKKKNVIHSLDLIKILHAMKDKYIIKTIDNLINKPNFSFHTLDLILRDIKLNNAICFERKNYIKYFINSLDFMAIINLYNHHITTDEDKICIKSKLYEKILDVKNAYNLALAQQITMTDIVLKEAIEKSVLNSYSSEYIFKLMSLKSYDKDKLMKKLIELKEVNANNRKYYVIALIEHYPEVIANMPFGLLVNDIMMSGLTKEENLKLITKAGNVIALRKKEELEKTYIDDETELGKQKKYNNLNNIDNN